MTAGIKTLELLKQEGTYEKLDAITSRLIEGIIQSAENNGIAIHGGSEYMFGFSYVMDRLETLRKLKRMILNPWASCMRDATERCLSSTKPI